jgi:hypothetical protein
VLQARPWLITVRSVFAVQLTCDHDVVTADRGEFECLMRALIAGASYKKGSLTRMYEFRNTGAKVGNYVLITTRPTASATEQEMTMSGSRALIAISAAIGLGIFGASVAQAGDSGENSQGGYVVPGSMVGVNPAYHRDLFGRSAGAGNAYGYAAPQIQKHRPARDQR